MPKARLPRNLTREQRDYAQKSLLHHLAGHLPCDLAWEDDALPHTKKPGFRRARARLDTLIAKYVARQDPKSLDRLFAQNKANNDIDWALKFYVGERERGPSLNRMRAVFETMRVNFDALDDLLSENGKIWARLNPRGGGALSLQEAWNFLRDIHSHKALRRPMDDGDFRATLEMERRFNDAASLEKVRSALAVLKSATGKALEVLEGTKETDWTQRQFGKGLAFTYHELTGHRPGSRHDDYTGDGRASGFEQFCADIVALLPPGYRRPPSITSFARTAAADWRASPVTKSLPKKA